MLKEFLCVGVVAKPQGIRGEIKVAPHTDDPERFLELKKVWIDGQCVPVERARVQDGCAYLTLSGVSDRNAAELLRGKELLVHRDDAVPLPEGRYFIVDLIGLSVLDSQGQELGRLDDILQAGGNDVYCVKGARNFMFPALKRVIVKVDIPGGRMVLNEQALSEVAVYDDD